jgi:hypothetical protein
MALVLRPSNKGNFQQQIAFALQVKTSPLKRIFHSSNIRFSRQGFDKQLYTEENHKNQTVNDSTKIQKNRIDFDSI